MMFSFPAKSYSFHEALCWKVQSSLNFARHLLMHECVSGDKRPKNKIEYYANITNGRASSLQCCMRQETRTHHVGAKSFRYYVKKPVRERMPREISYRLQRMSSNSQPDYPPALFYNAPADAVSSSSSSSSWKWLFYTLPNTQREAILIAVANQATFCPNPSSSFTFFMSIISRSWKP